MTKIVPFTKYRNGVYYLLKRAKRFHSTTCSVINFDITELMEARRILKSSGNGVSIHSCLVKATSLVLERYPRLNHHLFHGLFGKYEVDFEEISCNLIMLRRESGEQVLIPVVIERSNELSISEIDKIIRYHLTTPLSELPEIAAFLKVRWMPDLAMKWISYKLRSDHRFYRRYFGTYGYSPLIAENDLEVKEDQLGFATSIVANVCTAFHPCAVGDTPIFVEGKVVPRKTLTMTVSGDHYLIDAHEGMMAMRYMRKLIGNPVLLGLPDSIASPTQNN